MKSPLVRLARSIIIARNLILKFARTEQAEEELVAKLYPVIKAIAEEFLEAHDLVTKRIH